MIARFEPLPAAPVQTDTRPRQFRSRLCRAGASLIMTMAAMQTPAATGEPLSSMAFAVSAATADSAGALAGAKREPSAFGGNGPQGSATADVHLKFFGFLEFDWNSPGSGGVPGFDPLPDAPSHVVLADTSK
jgi:hypothetical protein